MSARRGAVLSVLVLSATFAAAGAAAQQETELGWDYIVRIADPASGTATVTIRLTGLDGIVERVGFRTGAHPYPITDVRSTESSLTPTGDGVQLNVRGSSESLTFTVDVRRDAHKSGEYNAYLGPDWGVFKAEAFALGFNYSFLEGKPFRWASTLQFDLPSGWTAASAYDQTAGSGTRPTFQLPAGSVLPRGFVAVGPITLTTETGAGKEFLYARLGEPLPYARDTFTYLRKSTDYYARVYGDVVGDRVFFVSAPSPMLKGGLGGTDSLFVHDASDLRTFAHEYAHVWQLFGTDLNVGSATVWVNEGDADLHGALSLFVTDYWSLKDVNDFLRGYHDERTQEPFRSGRLPNAVYGTPLEDLAYHKGALVLHALDALMRENTGGVVGLPDLLQALNQAHDQRVDESNAEKQKARLSPVSNDEVLATVNRVVQSVSAVDFAPFFDQFVTGSSYPPFEPVRAEENLVLANLTLTPARATAGATVVATVLLENRGLSPATKTVPLLVGGTKIDERTLTVQVGRTAEATFSFPAPGPGRHQVRSFYLEEYLDVLTEAAFVVERITAVPATFSVGETSEVLVVVRNTGELPGEANLILVADGGRVVGRDAGPVPGNLSVAFAFPVVFTSPGPHTLEAEVSGAGTDAKRLDVTVVRRDSDLDGVPDDEDAYPSNPQLSERSVPNEVRNVVPGPPALLVAAVVALAAAVALRRRDSA